MARRIFDADAGERVPLQTRTTAPVRDRLEAAAKRSGRSMSQEMEMRLEQSFQTQDIAENVLLLIQKRDETLVDLMGGPKTLSLLHALSVIIGCVEHDIGKEWHTDSQSKAAVFSVLETVLPKLIRRDLPAWGDYKPSSMLPRIQSLVPDLARVETEAEESPDVRLMTEEERLDFFHLRKD